MPYTLKLATLSFYTSNLNVFNVTLYELQETWVYSERILLHNKIGGKKTYRQTLKKMDWGSTGDFEEDNWHNKFEKRSYG
jgi:hypothetical protein